MQLTKGRWEVRDVTLSPDQRWFYLQTNEVSPFEQHLYRMSATGGALEKITSKSGKHDTVVSPDGQGLTSTDQSQAYVTAQRSAPAPPPEPVQREDCCQEAYYCETQKIEAAFDQQVAQCHHPGNAGCFQDAVSTKASQLKAAGEQLRLCNRTASGALSRPGPGTGGAASTAAGNDEFHSTERPGFFSQECQACDVIPKGQTVGPPERFDSSGGDRTPRDGSTRPPPPPSRVTPPAQQARAITRQYRLTVKSFIAHIGDNIGPTPRQRISSRQNLLRQMVGCALRKEIMSLKKRNISA